MPADDYTAAVSGGLKLKGVSSSSKVSKTRKNKRPKASESESTKNVRSDESKDEPTKDGEDDTIEQDESTRDGSERKLDSVEATTPPQVGKTEAELRHEERRRKRLDERLKREGTKTHKERVEELNRYLSNLSEHHDMYVSLFAPAMTANAPIIANSPKTQGREHGSNTFLYLGLGSVLDKSSTKQAHVHHATILLGSNV
ncbi:hypothetical protein BDR22DRAFT_911353 [Usnea florida]